MFERVRFSCDRQCAINAIENVASDLEKSIKRNLEDTREKSIALTKLEECFMWCGKALAREQIKSNE